MKLIVMEMDRRVFLLALSAAPLYPAAALSVFSPEESKLIEALCAQIVPADEYAGAKEAGVLYYIDQQLAGALSRFRPAYKNGIPAFDLACRTRTGQHFVDLPFTQQTAHLTTLHDDSFLEMLIDHTLQGFYGSPKHGGNRDEASWKMLGIADMMEGHRH